MNAFESVVAMLLAQRGYWVKSNFKVELTKAEKRQIGRPSSPRWEVDIVAYKGGSNKLLVVECKSYLDSPGVKIRGFVGNDERHKSRYKLFNDAVLREVVLRRLVTQLEDSGTIAPGTDVRLCLAAGKIASADDRVALQALFDQEGWTLFDEEWLRTRLLDVSNSGYENEIASIVAKLLLRE